MIHVFILLSSNFYAQNTAAGMDSETAGLAHFNCGFIYFLVYIRFYLLDRWATKVPKHRLTSGEISS